MPDITPDLLRRTAHQLEEDAAELRRAVDGLVDLAGPQTWVGGAPRRITADLKAAVLDARRAADEVDHAARLARSRADDEQRAQAISSLPG